MISLRGLGGLISFLGALLLGGAYVWWVQFFRQVAAFIGPRNSLPIECLYQMSGPCRMVATGANIFGVGAYDPLLFWAAILVIVVGLILVIFARPEPATRVPRTKDRIEPRL
jgi:hypothetical protein